MDNCIICETQDKETPAKYSILVNEDEIPVCEFHYKKHRHDKLIDIIEDEQSNIKRYNKRSNKKTRNNRRTSEGDY